MNNLKMQTKFNYGKFTARYQKMRLKTESNLLGRVPTRFYRKEGSKKKKK